MLWLCIRLVADDFITAMLHTPLDNNDDPAIYYMVKINYGSSYRVLTGITILDYIHSRDLTYPS